MAHQNHEELRRLYRIAQIYEREPLVKWSDVAKEYERLFKENIKRSIYRDVEKIRRNKIINFSISVPQMNQLETALVTKFSDFGLIDARASMVGMESEEAIRESTGGVTAAYFEEVVKEGDSVGIAGGYTLYEMIHKLGVKKVNNLKVYPLAGAPIGDAISSAGALVTLLCDHFGREPGTVGHELPSPFRDKTEKEVSITKNPWISDTYRKACNVDIAIMGIGILNPGSTLWRSMESMDLDPDKMKREGIIGDILYTCFDTEGEIVHTELADTILTVSGESLKKMSKHLSKKVIAVAGGEAKVSAIYAALKGGFFNVLITDESAAEALLNM